MSKKTILITSNGFKETIPFKSLKKACDVFGLNYRYLLGKIPEDGTVKFYRGYWIKKEELK